MEKPGTLEKAAILVVDDEAMLRFCAAEALEGEGFEVIEAANADEALKVLASRQDVRLLFTDIQMPGKLDGMDLARKVHEQWPKIKLGLSGILCAGP
jgi:two-component system, response regulator PdtaR